MSNWDYATHGYFVNIPPTGTNVMMVTNGDLPTYIDYPYGFGRVLATLQTIEYQYAGGEGKSALQGLLYDEINNALPSVKGIDISHHQWDKGAIDWTKVSQDGFKFAFIKATEGKTSQYPWFKEWPEFKPNMDNAHSANMFVGAYHFARPDFEGPSLEESATDEAKWFVEKAGDYIKPGYLRPALDIEWDHYDEGGNGVESRSPEYLGRWIDTWMSTVKSLTGVEPIIYTHHYYVNPYLNGETSLADYDVWMADTTSETTPDLAGIWNTWRFWQHTDKGNVNGIIGDVDLNLFNGNELELSNYVLPAPIVALQTWNDRYVCAEGSGGGAVVADRNAIAGWETFRLIPI
jgi:GH25 family lysozyme M1 (1,4-beta-N-acetylmuramidase)